MAAATGLERRALLAKAREMRHKNPPVMPKCTREVVRQMGRGRPKTVSSTEKAICGAPTIQNEPERERGVYWCPRCRRYSWGSGGGRAGGGPDVVPALAWAK